MFTAMQMTTCPNLAVPAEVMRHVVQVESASNPFAIGVVGGQLVRQPASLGEAMATVQMLDSKGYDYSLGVAQVNRRNLAYYGLDTYEKAFDSCANLTAGAQILAECYSRSGNDWGKAFSCYYSGNFVTGFRDGYVRKVYASMHLQPVEGSPRGTAPVALKPPPTRHRLIADAALPQSSPGYRAALRTVAIDNAAAATVSALAAVATTGEGETLAPTPAAEGSARAAPRFPQTPAPDLPVFKPVVRGPNDPVPGPARGTAAALSSTSPTNSNTEVRDAAFVF